jgi:hypothetical protein
VRAHAVREEYHALRQTHGDSVSPPELAKLRVDLELRHAAAQRQRIQIEQALEQYVPIELLLITSRPLRQELRAIAQAAQAGGSRYVTPHRVNHEIARCTWRTLTAVEPPPADSPGRGAASPREYLIHTAAAAKAQALITDDEELTLPDNPSPGDSATPRFVRSCTLHEFCQGQLPSQLDFDTIDAPAVFRAARWPPK